jgi:predicted ArsR family transcriptional regulator
MISDSRRGAEIPMQATRQRVLDALRQGRSMAVCGLASALDLSPMAVRHHLNILERDGLVQAIPEPRGGACGRPRLLFQVTTSGAESLPSNGLHLVHALLDEIGTLTEAALRETLLRGVAWRLAAGFSPLATLAPERRLDQMVTFLNNMGYDARWIPDREMAGNYLVTMVQCPYQPLAGSHPEVCVVDKELLARLSQASIERIARGDPADGQGCIYRLKWSTLTVYAAHLAQP